MSLTPEQATDALRAAGEPTRLRILTLLGQGELAVAELTRVLAQSQPRVSRHLRLLTEAGLIERFADGAWAFYRVTEQEPLREFVLSLRNLMADGGLSASDGQRLNAVTAAREAEAAAYFARSAARWDEIRSLYTAESAVEDAVSALVGSRRLSRIIDLGTGTGRMLTLLADRADRAVGIDLSQSMLNIARRNVASAALTGVELRHGDILATGLPDGVADLVVVHQVLHYLADPAAAVGEAARLVAPGGRLLLVDFAPHGLEFLRDKHQHRRLGFADEEIGQWLAASGLDAVEPTALPPGRDGGLTVKVWAATRHADHVRIAA